MATHAGTLTADLLHASILRMLTGIRLRRKGTTMALDSSVPTDHPLTTAGAALAHRLAVTRLRMARGARLCEVKLHLEALAQDTLRTLQLVEEHPDQEAVLLIDDLGPDADFLSTHLA